MLLSDEEIDRLLKVEKQVSNPNAKLVEKRGSGQVTYDAETANGEKFKVFVRKNLREPTGFSCGLMFIPALGDPVVLTRYNGSDHEHSNPLDSGIPLPRSCHIHIATERYMRAGRKAEHYAESTTRYNDANGALQALIHDCNIKGLSDNGHAIQLRLL